MAGAEELLRLLTGQPAGAGPAAGAGAGAAAAGAADPRFRRGVAGRPGVHTEVVIEAALAEGVVTSAVWAAGSLACRRRGPLPPEVAGVWAALGLPGVVAGERLAAAGRALAGVLLSPDGEEVRGRAGGGDVGGGYRRRWCCARTGTRWACRRS